MSQYQAILLDIEGTTSSIRFVHEVMFSYVRQHLAEFVEQHWDDESFRAAAEQIARDAGAESFRQWLASQPSPEPNADANANADVAAHRQQLCRHVLQLMDKDAKVTGLKQLQGLVWRRGFESGQLRAHVYEDVAAALERWREAGYDVRIYSSGSIAAQKLFFGHTEQGDLLSYLNGHYDTTSGGKKEADSYRRIAEQFSCPAEQILFVSDVADELDAARTAGLQTALSVRPGNQEVPPSCSHRAIHSFDEIR